MGFLRLDFLRKVHGDFFFLLLRSDFSSFGFPYSSVLASLADYSKYRPQMAIKRKCHHCGKPLRPEARNSERQRTCSRSACRRARRVEAQRKRRRGIKKDDSLTRRLKPSEASWLRNNPVIVGLVSLLIGSTNLKEIEAFCAAASQRGQDILAGTFLDDNPQTLEMTAWKQEKRRSV